jgi:hypothetical protein
MTNYLLLYVICTNSTPSIISTIIALSFAHTLYIYIYIYMHHIQLHTVGRNCLRYLHYIIISYLWISNMSDFHSENKRRQWIDK